MQTSELLKPFVPRLVVEWLRHAPAEPHWRVDGSLAFVDISGFTSMTERLARKGKVGAEEMNDVLDALFTELLAVAYDDGAGLVKWGGDAVLLLFDGEDHAPRACRAALNMQRTIKRIGKITTSVGQVRLRMSIGIHSGPFDFFLVGDPEIHRELVIVGPCSTRTVLMEQTAEATQVAVSPETAARIPADAVGEPKDEALLLRARSEVPFRPARPGPDISGMDLEQLVPVAIREYLLTGETQAEHRRITAGFLEFAGTDDFLAAHGPAAAADAIDTCVRTVQRAALQHGVGFFETDVARNAFRVMLIAGAPSSAGGDEDRMLGTLRSVAEADIPVAFRAGTNAGPVFAGYFGPQFRKTYSVKGDAVNTAARVMAKAESGQVLATASVLDPATALFEIVALEPFAAKGKRHPLHAWAVGRRIGTKGEVEELPLVGRGSELAEVEAALARARTGAGSVVEIVGAAGIGKTRLLRELFARAGGDRALRALCEPYQQRIAYRPIRAILRQALDLPKDAGPDVTVERLQQAISNEAPELEQWVPLLAAVLDLETPMTLQVADLGEEFRRTKLEEATVALLRALLPEMVLIAVEDAHWMDAGSAGILTRLANEIGSSPWLVVATRREESTGFVAPERDGCLRLELEPLSEDEARELVVSATESDPLRRHHVELLARRSGGNPLFLSQLLVSARGSLNADELPRSVENLVTAQIDLLPPFERRVLRCASVLGMSFTERLAVELLEADRDRATPALWARLGAFVEPEGSGLRRFRHALMRDAAYEGLPYRRRRELHASAAAAILAESEDPLQQAELLALHSFQAQRFDDAWEYARVAGTRALGRYANPEAASFLLRAIDAGRRAGVADRDLAATCEQLGDVQLRTNEFAAARTAFAAARRLVRGDPVAEAGLLYKEARVPYRAGRFSDSVRLLRRGMALVEGIDHPEGRRVFAKLAALFAGVRVVQGKYKEAERWCHRVVGDAAAVEELDALARAYYVLDFVYMDSGRVAEAVHSPKAIEIYEQLGDLNAQAEVISNSGADAYERGEWGRAIELYEWARELKDRVGDDGEVAIATANIAEIRLDQGLIDEAEPLLREAVRISRAGGYLIPHAFSLGLLGRIAAAEGRFQESDELFAEARSMFERIGNRPQVFEIDVRMVEVEMIRGDTAKALVEADRALRLAEEFGGVAPRVPLLHRIRAFAFLAAGKIEEARQAFKESLEAARARLAEHEVGLTLDAIVQLDRLSGLPVDPEAEEESRAILTRLGMVAPPQVPQPA